MKRPLIMLDRESLARLAALILFLAMLFAPAPADLPREAQALAAVTVTMGILWITNALPLAITALLPLLLFPVFGIQLARDVARSYVNDSVFLFLGGMIIALGLERWGLHRRIALRILWIVGGGPRRILMGFLLATAFLSMWISNTASTLLMMPIGLALLRLADSEPDLPFTATPRLGVSLMLAIAYGASIGGLTTLVGTPTNLVFTAIFQEQFPAAPEVGVGGWMLFALPIGVTLLAIAWCVLAIPLGGSGTPPSRQFFAEQLQKLGPMCSSEGRMLAVFVTTALLWMFRRPLQVGGFTIPGWSPWVSNFAGIETDAISDTTVAIGMAILTFVIPARREGKPVSLMDWTAVERLPWGLLLLFGGGFAIAGGFAATGLDRWLGLRFAGAAADAPLWQIIASLTLLVTFLTEFTTNAATASALLPILAEAARTLQVDPRLLMIPATLSTSCAFMLPIATPPNAIVFSSGQLRTGQMAAYGLLLNLLGAAVITVTSLMLLGPALEIDFDRLPEWAKASQSIE